MKSRFTAGLIDIVQDATQSFLEGSAADLRDYASVVASDAANAFFLPPPERDGALKELYAQLRVLGEMQRLRAEDVAWRTFQNTIELIAKTAVIALVTSV